MGNMLNCGLDKAERFLKRTSIRKFFRSTLRARNKKLVSGRTAPEFQFRARSVKLVFCSWAYFMLKNFLILILENLLIFDGVWEVVFIKVEAGFPSLAFAEAKVFHEFGRGVSEPNRNWLVSSFTSKVESSIPGVSGGARFFGE